MKGTYSLGLIHHCTMETIDFGCQVRVLNRQRLTVTSSHPQLSQCAAQFLAKVRQSGSSSSGDQEASSSKDGWMKLRLSERGLRIFQPSIPGLNSCYNIRRDEGFESDSEHSDNTNAPLLLSSIIQLQDSGGSSGVNSSSSDIEEPPESIHSVHHLPQQPINNGTASSSSASLRFRLEDILSCQHPPSLGRNICLLTLKSPEQALDILALECSAPESARILTLLCQKICSPSTSVSKESTNNEKPVVSIQSWSERTTSNKILDTPIVPSTSRNETAPESGSGMTRNIVKKLERQNSGWIQRLPSISGKTVSADASLTVKSIRRSETTLYAKSSPLLGQSSVMKKNMSTGIGGTTGTLTLKTPAEAPPNQPRWGFRRPTSPPPVETSVSASSASMRRGRSVERKKSQIMSNKTISNDSVILPTPPQPAPEVKIKRDQSKTRSFLMKLTSGGRNNQQGNKSPTPAASELSTGNTNETERALTARGRSLVRNKRSSAPPPSSVNSQTFLIPTKSGQDLARNTYPKELANLSGLQQQQTQTAVYHLVRPIRTIPAPQWPTAYWPTSGGVDPNGMLHHHDGNNNLHGAPWIYYSPHHHHHQAAAAAAYHHQHQQHAAAAAVAAAAAAAATEKSKRIHRSRSQSPRR